MNTIGWLFIFAGIIIVRQVAKGRVMNLPEDLGDAFIAFASGDTDALGGVLARSGDSATPTASAVDNSTQVVGTGGTASGLAAAAQLLGSKAKGYRWASTGPTYYDCSGLMWKACQAVGYRGPRFTTATVLMQREFKRISAPGTQGPGVTAAVVNDMVLWPAGSGGVTGHMGVITGPDKFYSARSVRSGIGEATISGFRKTRPIYVRYVGSDRKSKIEDQLN